MKKKLFGLILTLTLLAIVFSGCILEGGEEDRHSDDDDEKKVSGGTYIKNAEGRVNGSVIDLLWVYIALLEDSDPVDMNKMLLHIRVTPPKEYSTKEDLVYNSVEPGTPVPGYNYGASEVVDPLGAFPDELDEHTILKLTVILGGNSMLPTLPPDSDIAIKLMPAVGGVIREEEMTTPEAYPGDGGIVELTF